MFAMFGHLFSMLSLAITGTANLLHAYCKVTEIVHVKASEMLDATLASKAKALKALEAEAAASTLLIK